MDELEEAAVSEGPAKPTPAQGSGASPSTTQSQVKPNHETKPGPIGNCVGCVLPKTSPNLSRGDTAPAIKTETPQEAIQKETQALREQLREIEAGGNSRAQQARAMPIKERLDELAQQQEKLGGLSTGSAAGQYKIDEASGTLGSIVGAFFGLRNKPIGVGKRPTAPAKPAAQGKPGSTSAQPGGYITGNDLSKCKTGTYKDLQCPGGHKHHVVPARVTRTSTRADQRAGKGQIPGTDNINEGFSVCLSKDDHKKIHERTDPKIVAAGNKTTNGSQGTAPLGEIIELTVGELQDLFKENGNTACAAEVKKKSDDHFKNQDKNKQVNTTQNPKKELDPKVKNELKRQRTRLKR